MQMLRVWLCRWGPDWVRSEKLFSGEVSKLGNPNQLPSAGSSKQFNLHAGSLQLPSALVCTQHITGLYGVVSFLLRKQHRQSSWIPGLDRSAARSKAT
jgi:hypothetical protein